MSEDVAQGPCANEDEGEPQALPPGWIPLGTLDVHPLGHGNVSEDKGEDEAN